MKKIASIILTIIFVISIVPMGLFSIVSAETTNYTEGFYTYTVKNGEATITDCFTSISGDVTIPSTLGGYPVVKIGDSAFYDCDSLTAVTIGNNVTIIDSCAFLYCSNLTSVIIPNSVNSIGECAFSNCIKLEIVDFNAKYCRTMGSESYPAFKGCTNIKTIIIGEEVRKIPNYAFKGCSGVTTINYNANNCEDNDAEIFSYCTNLREVNIGETVKRIPSRFVLSCCELTNILIPKSVTDIGGLAFTGCDKLLSINVDEENNYYSSADGVLFDKYKTKLLYYPIGKKDTSYSIPNSVLNIEDWAFYHSYCLESISISNNVLSIGNHAFEACTSLTSITIPNSVTSIGDNAFAHCHMLTNVTIGNSVSSLGEKIFLCCDNLEVFTFPLFDKILTEYYDSCFGYLFGASSYSENFKYVPDSLKEVIITSPSTKIKSNFFYGCNGITSVTIPDSITSVGDYAFYGCERLSVVNYNANNCTSFGSYEYPAFSRCTTLKTVNISEDVEKIPDYAFKDCSKITDVYYNNYYKSRHEDLKIGNHNSNLIDANWHYTFCENSQHIYSINYNLTCEICGVSKEPNAPIIKSKTNNSVTLTLLDGYEYSKDGETWQTSNKFSNLSADTTYTFYQRVKKTSIALASEKSDGVTVTTKKSQITPTSPIISSFTDTTVILTPITNGEYSKDGTTWQSSNVFSGLSSGTTYTFYQRYAETDTHGASDKSSRKSVTTDKAKQTLIPDAPSVQNFTASSITLTPVDGCEYSKNGTTWQSSNVFSVLSCGTEYTFYQRYKETATTYVGKSSAALVTKTDKGTQTAPSAPTLENKTHNSVTLTKISGCEYSRDGINWQTSNVFTGLTPETNYMFYQRKAETDRYYESDSSNYLVVKTLEDAILESISVTTNPNKLIYLEGDAVLDTAGLSIRAYYNNDTSEVIVGNYTVTGYSTTPGTKTITVTYNGKTDTFTVTVLAKSLSSIAVTTKPSKLTYTEGEAFNKSGMVVTAYYNNNTSGVVTDYSVSGYTSTPGTKTITVTYGGKTATFNVTVKSGVPQSVTSSKFTVSGNKISKISAGTTVPTLLNGISEGSYCKVYKGSSEVSGSTAVGTGMVVKIMDGNTVKASYTVIITGDTNGDGTISVTDMIAIKAHILNKSTLTGVYATAANTNGDSGISITDFIQVKAKILGKGSITAR